MKNYILTEDQVAKKLQRMAYEIAEQNVGEETLILAGIKENGVVIAKKLKQLLHDIFRGEIAVMEIEVDDKRFPKKITLSNTENFDGAVIIVVDDVANSGKTMLYALQPFFEKPA